MKTIFSVGVMAALMLASRAEVVEYAISYPSLSAPPACHPAASGSTHEITLDGTGRHPGFWITGQNYDQVVHVSETGGMRLFPMPCGSHPHGIEFDKHGRLWVTWEFTGYIVRLDAEGRPDRQFDVRLDCPTCPDGGKINPHPHGLGFGADGETMWFTGKATGTVGKVTADGTVTTYPLKTVGSVPIYVRAGADGAMWVTELVGNAIAQITPAGELTEFPIPTHNARPIAIVPEPGSAAMWFSEEAGNRVARITADGTIAEFPVPMPQPNMILAGLAFDGDGDLWVQQYVDPNNPTPANPSPAGADYIVRLGKEIVAAKAGDLSGVRITHYWVPSTGTVMHRIVQGRDGNMWFTELATNKVGKLTR